MEVPGAGRLVLLLTLANEVRACPERAEGACPFWEPGGAVVEAGCMLERFLRPEERPPDWRRTGLRVRQLAVRRRAESAN